MSGYLKNDQATREAFHQVRCKKSSFLNAMLTTEVQSALTVAHWSIWRSDKG